MQEDAQVMAWIHERGSVVITITVKLQENRISSNATKFDSSKEYSKRVHIFNFEGIEDWRQLVLKNVEKQCFQETF